MSNLTHPKYQNQAHLGEPDSLSICRLVKYALNPHYNPDSSSPEHEVEYWHIKVFDDEGYREKDTAMLYRCSDGSWCSYSGKLCFRHRDGWIERIMDYERGRQDGFQKLYNANGKLREHYHITKEGRETTHFWWYPNGVLKRAVLCLPDGKKSIVFDSSGNVIPEQEDSI